MTTDIKAGELLSCIEEWAERLANCKAATRFPLPAYIHVEGQNSTISLTPNAEVTGRPPHGTETE